MADEPNGGQPHWRPKHNPFLIALTVTLATFMEVLDTSIANVALPHIAGDLGAGQDESTWVLTSYLVSNAIILPLSAWLSTVFGRKNFYLGCVVLFTLASFLCGIAPSLGFLILARILQGIGGGGLQPSEQAILADTFEPRQRGIAFALYGVAVVTAPAIGPTLGGWITDNYSWHWVFFINIPVGILSFFLSRHMVEDPPHVLAQRKTGKLNVDYIGFALIALGLGSLQVMLDLGEQKDWFESTQIRIYAALALCGIVGAVIYELNHKEPIVELRLLKERNFAVCFVLMFMLGFILLGSTVLLPLLAQTLMGYSAQLAGEVISPGGFLIMFLMPLVGFLLGKVQARFMIGFGLLVTATALWHMTGFTLEMDFWHLARARMWQAAGLAFLFVPINTIAYAFLPREKNNQASALINTARNIGGSCGIAFTVSMLSSRAQVHQADLVRNLTPGTPAYEQWLSQMQALLQQAGRGGTDALLQAQGLLMGTVQRQATLQAFIDNFLLLAILFAAMIPLVLLLKPNKPGQGAVGGH